ncbi:hypothetical protein ACI784_17405 [Geodermatophilus sp. SYSU D01186]
MCARLLPLRAGTRELWGRPSERLVANGVRVLTVPVDEEAVMDRLTREVLAGDPAEVPAAEAVARGTGR